jgi:hypothetical protein
MAQTYKAKLFLNDGSVEDMYGTLTKSQVDEIHKQMKRLPKKRLYVLGVNWSDVKKVEVSVF